MRTLPALLLLVGATAAHAQTIHRCETHEGHTSYQDRPCAESRGNLDYGAPPAGAGAAVDPSAEQAAGARAVAVNLAMLTQSANDRRDAGDSQNLQRCRTAMEIAALCGTTAAGFLCDHRGFVAAPVDATAVRIAVSNNRKYQIQRCATQAAQRQR